MDDNQMLTRDEFMREEGPFNFCLDPLDVNVAKMHQKIDREVRTWQEGLAYSTTEHWVSRNPEREISKVSIRCSKVLETQGTACCTITVRVTDKLLRYIAEQTVWAGTLSGLKRLMVGDSFLIVCKRELLWLNYALEHHADEKELLAAGWKWSGDVLPDFMDYVNEQLGRLLTEWDEAVVEHGPMNPVFDIFTNPDKGSLDKVGAYGLKIYKMPDDIVADADMRYVEAAVYDPSRAYKIDMIVMSGHSDDIKQVLPTTDFAQKVYDAYAKLLDLWDD